MKLQGKEMKINIGKYLNWWGPYQIADAIFFWIDKYTPEFDVNPLYIKYPQRFGDWLSKFDMFCNMCQWIYSKRKRKIKVKIDNYDVWNADVTLAHIILPVLKKLKEDKTGSPWVAPEDSNPLYHPRMYPKQNNPHDWDDGNHDRWRWVLDEMIFSFESILDEDFDEQFISGNGRYDFDRMKLVYARIDNGLMLFGKYYRGLWT